MRILHLSSLYPPHIVGGAERSVGMLADTQTALGHQVGAACISPDGWSRLQRNGVDVFRMPHENDFWMEDWASRTQAQREWAKFKQQANLTIERHFLSVIDEFRPDIVNTHSLVDVSTRVWRAAHRRGIPIVHTLRDFDLLCAASSMFRSETGPCVHRHLKCRVLTFAKQFDQKLVSAVTAVGQGVMDRHLQAGFFSHVPPDLRRVIWNTADVAGVEADYQPSPRTGTYTFGYLGRLSVEKGVDTLLRACRKLPHGGWRLVIAGVAQGSLDDLKALAEGLPVEFAGFMDPKPFFEQVDVLVVPSLWAEPLGRTVIEAYRMGVPVIGSRTGGVAELIANDEWLFAPGDADALGRRMAKLLALGRGEGGDLERRRSVVAATRAKVVAEAFVGLYEAVLGTPRLAALAG